MSAPRCPKCNRPMNRGAKTPSGKPRWTCRGGDSDRTYCYSTTDAKATASKRQDGKRSAKTPVFKRTLGGVTRLLITAAQNATPAHKAFVKAMEMFCETQNADILAVPLRYKNPTSRWTASQANEDVWADEFLPYLCNQRKRLNKNLVVLGDVKVQPTAVSPLTGFESLTHGESAIIGHPKLQLTTVATPQNRMPKILTTTGVATMRNYTDSRAGKQGEFHYTLGAALVEIKGKKFHLRQINADKQTGGFTDLETHYVENTAVGASAPLALVMGDTHVDFISAAVARATFGRGGMVDTLRPKTLVWHDLLDGYAVNPHHSGNPFNAIAKVQNNKADARAEVLRALRFVEANTPQGVASVVVPSNHDDFLTRWVLSQDWRDAPGNAEFYLESALAMVRGTKLDETGTTYPQPFAYWGRKLAPSVRFLEPDESFSVADIELGMHGDRGPNGSRGSRKNLRRIGVKSIVGHTHSPGIEEGCYQVGTSTGLKLEYTRGPSGWLNTHCLVYATGKRTLINIIDGEWRL